MISICSDLLYYLHCNNTWIKQLMLIFSLEGSLDWALLAAELEFPKILSTQASSAYIICKHWICQKVRVVKSTVFFTCDQIFGALMHLNFFILILMFLIYDAWCKLCNICLLLCENNSRSITIPGLHIGGKGKLKTKPFPLVDYLY